MKTLREVLTNDQEMMCVRSVIVNDLFAIFDDYDEVKLTINELEVDLDKTIVKDYHVYSLDSYGDDEISIITDGEIIYKEI